jgi:hypothetical protein
VTVRDADMMDMLLTGLLPKAVMDYAANAQNEKKDSIDIKEVVSLLENNGTALKSFYDSVVTAALITPNIGDVADDTHITLAELSFEDKDAIMEFINREVKQIKPFRDGEAKPVESLQHGDSVRKQAE